MVVLMATPATKLAEAARLAAHLHFVQQPISGYHVIESSVNGQQQGQ